MRWTMGPDYAGCYIISDVTGEAVIIDACAYSEQERQKIARYIEKEHLILVRHLLTHGHYDHLYGCEFIHERFGVLPEIHIADVPIMAAAPERFREARRGKEFPVHIPAPEHFLEDGEIVKFGNHQLKVIHTPGHSPGSCFFYCEEEDIAFSGDTLFDGSIGNFELEGSNKEDLKRSLIHILDTLPDETVIYCGHPDRKTTIGREKRTNTVLVDFLADRL